MYSSRPVILADDVSHSEPVVHPGSPQQLDVAGHLHTRGANRPSSYFSPTRSHDTGDGTRERI
jgi:hypothetical protein